MSSTPHTARLSAQEHTPQFLPVVSGLLRAGFPSPADDFAVGELDLVELLVPHPLATFFWQVSGKSMEGAGIYDRDILVVDKSLRPAHGDIVVAEVDGAFTVKFLHKTHDEIKLVAANPDFKPITFGEEQQLVICGVVTAVIKRFTRHVRPGRR